MRAKITKVVKNNGDEYFYVYSDADDEDNWNICECVFIPTPNDEEKCLERAMKIASKIESTIAGETIMYITPMS